LGAALVAHPPSVLGPGSSRFSPSAHRGPARGGPAPASSSAQRLRAPRAGRGVSRYELAMQDLLAQPREGDAAAHSRLMLERRAEVVRYATLDFDQDCFSIEALQIVRIAGDDGRALLPRHDDDRCIDHVARASGAAELSARSRQLAIERNDVNSLRAHEARTARRTRASCSSGNVIAIFAAVIPTSYRRWRRDKPRLSRSEWASHGAPRSAH
jgi:hypothetical protein